MVVNETGLGGEIKRQTVMECDVSWRNQYQILSQSRLTTVKVKWRTLGIIWNYGCGVEHQNRLKTRIRSASTNERTRQPRYCNSNVYNERMTARYRSFGIP
jgi:hypothetical protein